MIETPIVVGDIVELTLGTGRILGGVSRIERGIVTIRETRTGMTFSGPLADARKFPRQRPQGSSIPVIRLPEAWEGSILEHLVRWHGMYVEEAEELEVEYAMTLHERLHREEMKTGKRLGHVHSLTPHEEHILREGAESVLRGG